LNVFDALFCPAGIVMSKPTRPSTASRSAMSAPGVAVCPPPAIV